MLHEGIEHESQPSGKHLVERKTLIDPVVGEPVLRKVVGADSLRTVTRSDEAFSGRSPLFMLCLSLSLVQACLQHAEGLGKVLVLTFFILALHNNASLKVGEPHRRCRLIDMLTSRAACAEEILAILVRRD